jgi:hypothetical protein
MIYEGPVWTTEVLMRTASDHTRARPALATVGAQRPACALAIAFAIEHAARCSISHVADAEEDVWTLPPTPPNLDRLLK